MQAGWVQDPRFLAQNWVTPAHFDIEHSLLMQVSGAKTVSIGRFENDQTKRHEVDRYWDGSHGRVEGMPTEVASYSLTPGRGVYIPPVVPHWVTMAQRFRCLSRLRTSRAQPTSRT